MVLKLTGRRHNRTGSAAFGGAGSPVRGVVFIRPRETAALRRFTLNTIDDELSSNIPVLVEGRFDILSLRQAGAMGVAIVGEDLILCKADKVRQVLVHQEIAPERAAQTKAVVERVQGEAGQVVVVQTSRKVRALNLDD